jgi:hypothetical protein
MSGAKNNQIVERTETTIIISDTYIHLKTPMTRYQVEPFCFLIIINA